MIYSVRALNGIDEKACFPVTFSINELLLDCFELNKDNVIHG